MTACAKTWNEAVVPGAAYAVSNPVLEMVEPLALSKNCKPCHEYPVGVVSVTVNCCVCPEPSDLEVSALALYESRKKPLSEEDLERLAAIGKQPEPEVVLPVADADLPSAIAAADEALRQAGFVEGRQRPHRNRE
jgi:hypothetical protein